MNIQSRIDPLHVIHRTTAAKDRAAAASAGGPGHAPRGAATAQAGVALSTTAATATFGDGDFDAAKVERINAALSAGTFKIDAEAIVDGLIADAKAFVAHGLG